MSCILGARLRSATFPGLSHGHGPQRAILRLGGWVVVGCFRPDGRNVSVLQLFQNGMPSGGEEDMGKGQVVNYLIQQAVALAIPCSGSTNFIFLDVGRQEGSYKGWAISPGVLFRISGQRRPGISAKYSRQPR